MDLPNPLTDREIAVNAIVEEYFPLVNKISRMMSSSTGINESDLNGPGSEGLWKGSQAVVDGKSNKETKAYLTTCIRNAILDFVRREHRHGFVEVAEEDNILPPLSLETPKGTDGLTIGETISADVNDMDGLKSDVLDMIAHLPFAYRTIFLIKFEDPMVTDQEISVKLGLSLAEVKHRIARGRKYFGSF